MVDDELNYRGTHHHGEAKKGPKGKPTDLHYRGTEYSSDQQHHAETPSHRDHHGLRYRGVQQH